MLKDREVMVLILPTTLGSPHVSVFCPLVYAVSFSICFFPPSSAARMDGCFMPGTFFFFLAHVYYYILVSSFNEDSTKGGDQD